MAANELLSWFYSCHFVSFLSILADALHRSFHLLLRLYHRSRAGTLYNSRLFLIFHTHGRRVLAGGYISKYIEIFRYIYYTLYIK